MTNNLHTWPLRFFCILLLCCCKVYAQQNTAACGNSYQSTGGASQKALGVCGLDGQGGGPLFTANYSQSAGLQLQAPINFQVRSCTIVSCLYATQYNVRLTPNSGSSFSLTNGSGDSIPLSFSFRQLESGQSANLTAGNLTDVPFNSKGNGQYSNTQLSYTLTLTPDQLAALEPGTYDGTFRFAIQQRPYIFFIFDVGSETLGDMLFNIRLEVLPNVRIFGLNDVPLSRNPTGPYYARRTEDFCVFSQGGGLFSVLAESDNSNVANEFHLQGQGSGDRIAYQLQIRGIGDSRGFVSMTEGSASGYFWAGNTSPLTCAAGQENMRLRISVLSSQADSASSDNYQDTLRLTVTPE